LAVQAQTTRCSQHKVQHCQQCCYKLYGSKLDWLCQFDYSGQSTIPVSWGYIGTLLPQDLLDGHSSGNISTMQHARTGTKSWETWVELYRARNTQQTLIWTWWAVQDESPLHLPRGCIHFDHQPPKNSTLDPTEKKISSRMSLNSEMHTRTQTIV